MNRQKEKINLLTCKRRKFAAERGYDYLLTQHDSETFTPFPQGRGTMRI
jgi:hypothetical protein